jgi:hypothetical protein
MVSGEGTKYEYMDFIIQVIILLKDLVSIFPRHVPARESV